MRKLLCMALALVTVVTGALACEALLPRDEGTGARAAGCVAFETFTGCSGWAVEKDSRELAGIKCPEEQLEIRKGLGGKSAYIRGNAQGGLIRAKCVIRVDVVAGMAAGMTELDSVEFRIPAQYLGFVSEIVERRIGTELSAASIAAATLWRRGDTVAHIFWPDEAVTVAVGEVYFNRHEFMTVLWAGDFDGDGQAELGFRFGVPYPTITRVPEATATQEPTPEPTAEPTKKPGTVTKAPAATKAPCVTEEPQKATCAPKATCEPCQPKTVKVCWDFGFDLSVWWKGCVTWFTGCCK